MKMERTYAWLFLLVLTCASCSVFRRTRVTPEWMEQVELPVPQRADTAATARPVREAAADSVGTAVDPGQTPADPLPLPSLHDQVINYAKTFLGTPYKYGAPGPKLFDCSGFTRYVFAHFGYDLTHSSALQFREGRRVDSYADLQKGDLVFFGARNNIRAIGHVGIVVDIDREHGSFRFIHASVSNGVEIQRSNHPYFMMRYMGAVRFLPDLPEEE